MGKQPKPARTNRIRTQVLPRTEQNPIPRKEPNKTRTQMSQLNSVLSLNESVGTFTDFTVNEAFYFT